MRPSNRKLGSLIQGKTYRMDSLLPNQFKDLDFLGEWALASELGRNRKRRESTMEEIQRCYHALLPRMDEIVAYLNSYTLDDLSPDAQRLLYLALSFMEISPAVELFNEPDENGVFAATRFKIIEPACSPVQ